MPCGALINIARPSGPRGFGENAFQAPRSGDGAVIDVPTRDHAFLNPTGRLVVVFTDNDGARVLDVALVTGIDYAKAPEDLGR